MRVAFVLLLAVHGLIHLAGFVEGFRLSDVEALGLSIGRAAGVLWLLAALGFLASAVMFPAAPARVDATWKMPQGDFVYGEFNLDKIECVGGALAAFGSSGG